MAEIVVADPTAEIILKHLDRSTYFRSFLNHDVRIDGRKFSAMRNVSVKTGTISSPSCYGSALASIGGTNFSSGVTLQIGTPSYQRPDCGDISEFFALSILHH
jgi:exosome complex RNA-binding protein Rrp42 (RNase PH superfamily)